MLEINDIAISTKQQLLFTGSLKAHEGQITLIMGPVGSGKTTFLNQLYQHQLMTNLNFSDESWFSRTGYVNQDVHQYDDMTCDELKACFCFDDTITFADVGLFASSKRKIKQFSEGEKQRINILVALWKKPAILLLDEPTSYLDTKTAKMILELLCSYTKAHHCITLITSHHQMDKDYADVIYEISQKQLIITKSYPSNNQILNKQSHHLLIDSLLGYVEKNVLLMENKIALFILLASFLAIGGLYFKTNQMKANWFEKDSRYCLSQVSYNEGKPIYYTPKTIYINDEIIPIGIMSYENDMNLHTKTVQKTGDIVVSESLARKLNNQSLKVAEKEYVYSNVFYDDLNERFIQKRRYLLFIPADQYTIYDDTEVFSYALTYHDEKRLARLAGYFKQDTDFIGYSPQEAYKRYHQSTQSIEATLFSLPLVSGIGLLAWAYLFERRKAKELLWLRDYGMPLSAYRKWRARHQCLVWISTLFLIILILVLPLFPLWTMMTILLYLIGSVYCIFIKKK